MCNLSCGQVSVLTINIESVLICKKIRPTTLKLLTIIKGFNDMIRVPTHRPPTHPGEMLLEEFLKPMGLTQRQLADAIHVPYQRINELINSKRGMTPATALRLERFFGMSAGFWMNLQLRWDLYHARQDEATALVSIQPYKTIITQVGKAQKTG
jgi:addiction module HigA family antidote